MKKIKLNRRTATKDTIIKKKWINKLKDMPVEDINIDDTILEKFNNGMLLHTPEAMEEISKAIAASQLTITGISPLTKEPSVGDETPNIIFETDWKEDKYIPKLSKPEVGHKDTMGKLPLNLVPPHAYEAIALIREYGNKKYGDPWKWLTCVTIEDFIGATRRHMLKYQMGETIDPESKLPHLDHALCSIAMAVELTKRSVKHPSQHRGLDRYPHE